MRSLCFGARVELKDRRIVLCWGSAINQKHFGHKYAHTYSEILLASRNEVSPSSRYLVSLRAWFCALALFRKITVAWYSSVSLDSRDVIQRLQHQLVIFSAIYTFRIALKDRLRPSKIINTHLRSSCFDVKVSCLIIGWISTPQHS